MNDMKDTHFNPMNRARHRLWGMVVWALCLMAASEALGQDVIQGGETLDLKRCIAIALQHHPSIKSSSGILAASRSRIDQARSAYFPQVGWTTEASRIHPAGGASSNGNGDASYSEYATRVGLTQKLFDFGRTSAQTGVRALEAEAAAADLGAVRDRIVYQVILAYYALLSAEQNREVHARTVTQFEQHLQRARTFFEIGVRSKIDVTKAEVDLSRARLNLLMAENALTIAGLTLKNAIGVPEAPDFEVKEMPLPSAPVASQEQALERAFAQRPDLRAVMSRREAAQRAVDLARTGCYPALDGKAAYGFTDREFPLEEEWSIGIGLSIPLFNGLLTRSQVDEAVAFLSSARAEEELARQTVRFDIAQAYANLSNVRQRFDLAEVSLMQAVENRGLAEGRYAAGVGDALEVTDAVVAEVAARTESISARYDYQIALAALARAMGERLD
ncbi:MAG TPA: TolC family protein [Deltaproteobacteria bacterium]|nr:TolC family protein [Deltaproteobacteria bacterium]